MLTNVILRKVAVMAVTIIVGIVLISKGLPKYIEVDMEKNETSENPKTFEKQMNKYTIIFAACEVVVLGATFILGKLI